MAIERSEMTESAPVTDSEQSETTEIPMSIVGNQDVKEGDVVRLRVVGVGDGTLTVKYAAPDKMEGSEGMAREFDKPSEEGMM